MWPRLPLPAAALLALTLGGCDAPREATVRVCSDLVPGAGVQQVRLTLYSADLRTVRFAGVRDVVPLDGPATDGGVPDTGLDGGVDAGPARDAGPGPGAAPCGRGWQGRFTVPEQPTGAWVEAQALVDGLPTVSGRARMQAQAAAVTLQAACAGVDCPAGQSCRDGACSAAPEGDDGAACGLGCSP